MSPRGVVFRLAVPLALIGGGFVSVRAQVSPPPADTVQAPTVAEQRVLAILEYYGSQGDVVAPASVKAGEEFPVTITTWGGGCDRAGDQGTLREESAGTVMVYDFTAAIQPGVICPTILKRLSHTATMRFTKAGDAVIRVWGRRVGTDTPPGGVPTVVERHLTVQ